MTVIQTGTNIHLGDFDVKTKVFDNFATVDLHPPERPTTVECVTFYLRDENEAAILAQAFNDIKRLREQAVPDQEPAEALEPAEAED